MRVDESGQKSGCFRCRKYRRGIGAFIKEGLHPTRRNRLRFTQGDHCTLAIARKRNYLFAEDYRTIDEQAEELVRMLSGLRSSLTC